MFLSHWVAKEKNFSRVQSLRHLISSVQPASLFYQRQQLTRFSNSGAWLSTCLMRLGSDATQTQSYEGRLLQMLLPFTSRSVRRQLGSPSLEGALGSVQAVAVNEVVSPPSRWSPCICVSSWDHIWARRKQAGQQGFASCLRPFLMIDYMKNSNIHDSLGLINYFFNLNIHNQQKIMNLVILIHLLTDLNEFSVPILFSIFRNCALITTLRIT